MNIRVTAPYKRELLAQRASLLDQLARLRGGAVGRAEASATHFARPEDSRAQLATERDLEFALDARESAELAAIDAALARIEDGSYGICVDCGADIAAARLRAAPEALRCVACQGRFELVRKPTSA